MCAITLTIEHVIKCMQLHSQLNMVLFKYSFDKYKKEDMLYFVTWMLFWDGAKHLTLKMDGQLYFSH